MKEKDSIIQNKSELLFMYESSYSMPNGDPFTGEQRYDEESKKILVSDVRIKRFIRDYLETIDGEVIYVSDKTTAGKTNSAGVIKHLFEKTFECKIHDVKEILRNCIDVRLFGGIATLKEADSQIKVDNKEHKLENSHSQFTGPVQFSLLNPSLNKVNMRIHQNTSHFISSEGKTQGAIGTTTLVPYALLQIHGWINPLSAIDTKMSIVDESKMIKALWRSVNNVTTRTKHGDSVFMVQVIYQNNYDKIYGLDQLIKIAPTDNQKKEEAFRSREDFKIDFSEFAKKVKSEKVSEIKYFTEIDKLEENFLETLGINIDEKKIKDEKHEIHVKKFDFSIKEKDEK
ncbi:MAG: type I-B CRISPR-associated protein Cas7/Csh2 [Bacteroidales bacterium]|nr:type I-B CRISPR-associated protein Cas7/Csh2 [Bacteroidales bacterium]MCF8345497.1 type I-B CRISPR-associated protein Cas7/Csh2 [Bacteroidales bacterium]MCF8351170.1 type I-B CRISPR-associated protein Cas7/Csh2 [Bacteroidales bacterium]MCF8377690.1 type I-B CRISPR-associated protein Cas7/Csh2 [Bacteroidales bacterium]